MNLFKGLVIILNFLREFIPEDVSTIYRGKLQ